jgi:hypothetical protein
MAVFNQFIRPSADAGEVLEWHLGRCMGQGFTFFFHLKLLDLCHTWCPFAMRKLDQSQFDSIWVQLNFRLSQQVIHQSQYRWFVCSPRLTQEAMKWTQSWLVTAVVSNMKPWQESQLLSLAPISSFVPNSSLFYQWFVLIGDLKNVLMSTKIDRQTDQYLATTVVLRVAS